VLELGPERPLERLRLDELALERHVHVQHERPVGARLQLDPVAHRGAVPLARLREHHLGHGAELLVLVREDELAAVRLPAVGRRGRERDRVQRVAEREVARLDEEDVREVALELERELERERLHRLVPDRDAILHAVLADEALAHQRDRVLRQAGEGVAQVEGCGEVVDLVRREQQRARPVEAQAQVREEARVPGEEAARGLCADVAELVADAEGRAFEDPELH
jgi:hypothetical protein